MLSSQEPRRSQRKPKLTPELQSFLNRSPRKAAKMTHMDNIHAYSFMEDGDGDDELGGDTSTNGDPVFGLNSPANSKDGYNNGKVTTVAMVHDIPYVTPVSSPDSDRSKIETPVSPTRLLNNCCIVPLDEEITFLKSVRDPNARLHKLSQNRRRISTRSTAAADLRVTQRRSHVDVVEKTTKPKDRKAEVSGNASVGETQQAVALQSEKRKRGRPSKKTNLKESTSAVAPVTSVKRPRGRPKFYCTDSKSSVVSHEKEGEASNGSTENQSLLLKTRRRSLAGNVSRYTTPVSVNRRGRKSMHNKSIYSDWLSDMSSAIMSPGSDLQTSEETFIPDGSYIVPHEKHENEGVHAAAVLTPPKRQPNPSLKEGETPVDVFCSATPKIEESGSQQTNDNHITPSPSPHSGDRTIDRNVHSDETLPLESGSVREVDPEVKNPEPAEFASPVKEQNKSTLESCNKQPETTDTTQSFADDGCIEDQPSALSDDFPEDKDEQEVTHNTTHEDECRSPFTAKGRYKQARNPSGRFCHTKKNPRHAKTNPTKDSCSSPGPSSQWAKTDETLRESSMGVSEPTVQEQSSSKGSPKSADPADKSNSPGAKSPINTEANTSRSFNDRDEVFGISYAYSGKKKKKRRGSGMHRPLYKNLAPSLLTPDLTDESSETSFGVLHSSSKKLQEDKSLKVGESPNSSFGFETKDDDKETENSAIDIILSETSCEQVELEEITSTSRLDETDGGSLVIPKEKSEEASSDEQTIKSGIRDSAGGKRNARRRSSVGEPGNKKKKKNTESTDILNESINKSGSSSDSGHPVGSQTSEISSCGTEVQSSSGMHTEPETDSAEAKTVGNAGNERQADIKSDAPVVASEELENSNKEEQMEKFESKTTGRTTRRSRSRRSLCLQQSVATSEESDQTILDHCVSGNVKTESETGTGVDSHLPIDESTDNSGKVKSIKITHDLKDNQNTLSKRESSAIVPDEGRVEVESSDEIDQTKNSEEIFISGASSSPKTMFDDDETGICNPDAKRKRSKPKSGRRVSIRTLQALYSDSVFSPEHFTKEENDTSTRRKRRRSFLDAQSAIFYSANMTQQVAPGTKEQKTECAAESVSVTNVEGADVKSDSQALGTDVERVQEDENATESIDVCDAETDASPGSSVTDTDAGRPIIEPLETDDDRPDEKPAGDMELSAENAPEPSDKETESKDDEACNDKADKRKPNRRKSASQVCNVKDKSNKQSTSNVKEVKKSKSELAVEKLYTSRGPKKAKKRNLETIFESPRPDNGGKTTLTGARKMSRMMTFKDPVIMTKIKAAKAKKLEQHGVKKFKPARNLKTKKAVAVTLEDKLNELEKELSVVVTPVKIWEERNSVVARREQENVYDNMSCVRIERDTRTVVDALTSPLQISEPVSGFRRKRLSSLSSVNHGLMRPNKKLCSSSQSPKSDSNTKAVSSFPEFPGSSLGLSPKMIVDGTEVDPNVIVKLEKLEPGRHLHSPMESGVTPKKPKQKYRRKAKPQDVTNTWTNNKVKTSISSSPAQVGLDSGLTCLVTKGSNDQIYYDFGDTDHNYCKSPDKIEFPTGSRQGKNSSEKKANAGSTKKRAREKSKTCARKISMSTSPVAASYFNYDDCIDSEMSSTADTCSMSSQDVEDANENYQRPDDLSVGDHCYAATWHSEKLCNLLYDSPPLGSQTERQNQKLARSEQVKQYWETESIQSRQNRYQRRNANDDASPVTSPSSRNQSKVKWCHRLEEAIP
ncbi:microtubule-associated protein futsch-like [Ptychodera flava]|uniref:microtubule-associated protein futsch-like n=1 Tax=Ptychodera flava TaxID=63121 RepID=UPI00396A750F